MTALLEDYAMIGDCESAALVARTGSIDWLCWPRFDSDACFAALLGDSDTGHWVLSPDQPPVSATRRYRDDTLILETDFATTSGAVRVTDFMPVREGAPALIRIATGLRGSVKMRSVLRLRFAFGAVPPWFDIDGGRTVATVGPDLMVLDTDVSAARGDDDVCDDFILAQGERRSFVLQFGSSRADPPKPIDAARALSGTERYWREWIGKFEKPTRWPQAVRRSLLTLKALISRSTGGILAAPTTSLPEVPGGSMNWDYRYCWLRDAAFTISALLNAGYHREAREWRDWILRTVAGTPERIQVMYRLDGGRHLREWEVSWLSGYRWSRPVRIGNGAAHQRQIDIFGEILDVLSLATRAGIEPSSRARVVQEDIVQRVARVWRRPGQGIWESRGEARHYVYSRVMAWVAVDRLLRSKSRATNLDVDDKLRRMAALRSEIHQEVCSEGFDAALNSFVQYYGSQEVDASLLLVPLVGFLPIDDSRVTGTIERVERELVDDGLVYRTANSRRQSQGAFLACSGWLADCQQLQGRTEAASGTFERLLAARNDVGLLAEQYNLRSRHLAGNFPQALSHLALVTTALGLSGPVLQRGGG